MATTIPTFRTEQARQFLRGFNNFVSTQPSENLIALANNVFVFTASANQKNFTGQDVNSHELTFVPGRIQVFKNGTLLSKSQYVEVSSSEIILETPCSAQDYVVIAAVDFFNVNNSLENYYLFLGRSIAFDEDDTILPDGNLPEQVNKAIKSNIVAIKRILPSDSVMVVDRNDWQAGTIYDSYTDSEDYTDLNFYVYNPDNFRIYKCLKSTGEPATDAPTSELPAPFYTDDGYFWKLMYEVPFADRVKFLTEDVIPVRSFSSSTTFDMNGYVRNISIVNAGTGYTTAPQVIILGDGVGATATVELLGGSVSTVKITNVGYGYTFAYAKLIGTTVGVEAELSVSLGSADLPLEINKSIAQYAAATDGAIDFIEVVSEGQNYLGVDTTIEIVGDGTGASALPILQNTRVIGVDLLSAGKGYTVAKATVKSPSSPVGNSAASLRVILGPQGGHGGNILKELFARKVAVAVNADASLYDIFVNNDFNQLGIVKNIKNFTKDAVYLKQTGTACFSYEAETPSDYSIDDVLENAAGTKRYLVVNKNQDVVYFLPIYDDRIETTSEIIAPEEGDMTPPEISTQTGELIYVKNISPVTRQIGQVEQFKLYFSF